MTSDPSADHLHRITAEAAIRMPTWKLRQVERYFRGLAHSPAGNMMRVSRADLIIWMTVRTELTRRGKHVKSLHQPPRRWRWWT